MRSRFLFTVVLIISLCSFAFSQKPGGGGSTGGGGNTGGGNSGGGSSGGVVGAPNMTIPEYGSGAEVQIRIAWPNERSVEEALHVQLLNSTNTPVQDTFSRPDGTVSFHNIIPGNYRLRVDGADIKEVVTDAFTIYRQEHMHMEWVHVTPKEKENANVPGSGPMISATELNAPPKAKSEMEKGMEAFAKNDLKKADEKLTKAVEIYPKYSRAWNNLGVVRMRENNQEGAQEAFQKCVDADSKFTPCYTNLARLSMMNKDMPQAAALLNKGLAADPNNVEALALLAKEQLLTGDYAKSLATARKVHGLPHDHMADVHLIAGEALLHQNRDSEAIQEFEMYLKEYPDSPNAAKVRTAMAQIQAKQTKTN